LTRLNKHIVQVISIFINILIIYSSSYSQTATEEGMPFLKNFQNEYYPFISDQTWTITQDKNGLIYFGNNNGLIEYDGTTYRLLKIGGDVAIRSMAYDIENDRIYIGATSEFGYLEKTENGDRIYICLSDSLTTFQVKTTWKIFCTTHGVYFLISRNQLVRYYENKLIEIENKQNTSEFRGFLINDTIILADTKNGFLVVEGDRINKLNYGFEPSFNDVRSIIPETDTSLILLTTGKGIYRWSSLGINSDFNRFHFINTPVNNYLIKNSVYYCIKKNNSIIIATLIGGLIVLDENLEIITILTKSNGLNSNGIYFLNEDKENNIWIGSEKGLSQLNINFPFKKFTELNGIDGIISAINRYKNTLFVGTYDGIFYLSENSFKKLNSY
jgi:ligand-binding sensor domain-containing protein